MLKVVIYGVCVLVLARDSHAQVPCHYIPNGVNITLRCANGFWQTTTPDGEVHQGNGTYDPNEQATGSTIPLGQTGPNAGAVQAPKQLQMLAPYQGQTYGYPNPD